MKRVRFEEGKTYGGWNHGQKFTVTKRTRFYVWFNGCKKSIVNIRIDGNLVESIIVGGSHRIYSLCER